MPFAHAARLLLSTSDMPLTSVLSVLAKPVLYVAVFCAYGVAVKTRSRWTKPLLAGAVRTALGYALFAVTLVVVTSAPPELIQLFVGVGRFGLWYGLCRLFFPKGTGRGAALLAIVGVALNVALDWALLGGVVAGPA